MVYYLDNQPQAYEIDRSDPTCSESREDRVDRLILMHRSVETLREFLGVEDWISDPYGNDALLLFLCHPLHPEGVRGNNEHMLQLWDSDLRSSRDRGMVEDLLRKYVECAEMKKQRQVEKKEKEEKEAKEDAEWLKALEVPV